MNKNLRYRELLWNEKPFEGPQETLRISRKATLPILSGRFLKKQAGLQ